MQAETTAPATEQVTEHLTEDAIRTKIKHMVVDLINRDMRGMSYTPRQIKPEHTFDQLSMTDHEKARLFMQCEEFFRVDFGATAHGFKQLEDLMAKVIMMLKDQGRLEVVTADEVAATEPA